jgi:hypothetical protein
MTEHGMANKEWPLVHSPLTMQYLCYILSIILIFLSFLPFQAILQTKLRRAQIAQSQLSVAHEDDGKCNARRGHRD